MKKSLGSKRKFITDEQRDLIIDEYHDFEDSERSKIFPNEHFGYTKVVVEQPKINKNGKIEKDKKGYSKRESERIPLSQNVDEYFNNEVKPHLENGWMDRAKDRIGYEINFTKYFYQYQPLRSLSEITTDLMKLEEESEGLFHQMVDSK